MPGYLELLHLRGPGAAVVLRRILIALQHRDAEPCLRALFADANWRPHLVGGLAALARGAPDVCGSIWQAVGRSWAAPQLAVALFFLEPGLAAGLRAQFAGGLVGSPKAIASLLEIAGWLPELREWRAQTLARQDVRAALSAGVDHAVALVSDWRAGVEALFGGEGLTLPRVRPA
ncbi:MAG: hypothetical protein AAF628_05960 [Planctomycetota bacterium]